MTLFFRQVKVALLDLDKMVHNLLSDIAQLFPC